jgi:hypothetical protein
MKVLALIGRAASSLVAGALFGLAISTSVPVAHSAAAGAGAAAFVYAAYHRFERTERRADRSEPDAATEQAAGDGDTA